MIPTTNRAISASLTLSQSMRLIAYPGDHTQFEAPPLVPFFSPPPQATSRTTTKEAKS